MGSLVAVPTPELMDHDRDGLVEGKHAPPPTGVSAEAVAGANAFLSALGVGLTDTARRETAVRMAQAFTEMLSPRPFKPTMFPNPGYDDLLVVSGIRFAALCAHHVLPFTGTAVVGYQPGDLIIGLSKLARLVHYFAGRLQVQEQLTVQVADWLTEQVQPRAVGVRLVAEHLCMSARGVREPVAVTTTTVRRGALAEDPVLQQRWSELADGAGR